MKKFILGAIIGALLMISASAFADDIFTNVSVIINGKTATGDNAPITYNGTTYVPIRYVADSIGANIYYDHNTRTVTITGSIYNNIYNPCIFPGSTVYDFWPYLENGTKIYRDGDFYLYFAGTSLDSNDNLIINFNYQNLSNQTYTKLFTNNFKFVENKKDVWAFTPTGHAQVPMYMMVTPEDKSRGYVLLDGNPQLRWHVFLN